MAAHPLRWPPPPPPPPSRPWGSGGAAGEGGPPAPAAAPARAAPPTPPRGPLAAATTGLAAAPPPPAGGRRAAGEHPRPRPPLPARVGAAPPQPPPPPSPLLLSPPPPRSVTAVAAADGGTAAPPPPGGADATAAVAAARRWGRPWYGATPAPAGEAPPPLPPVGATAAAAPPLSGTAGRAAGWSSPPSGRMMRVVRAVAAAVAAATLTAILFSAPATPAGLAARPAPAAAAAAVAASAAGSGELSSLPPAVVPPSGALPFRPVTAAAAAPTTTAGDTLSAVAALTPPRFSIAAVTAAIDGTRCSGSSGCLGRWKTLFVTALFVEGVAGGLAPSCLRLLASPERALHVANAFSGGVFFATGMLHVLPEAVEHLNGGGHGHQAGHATEAGGGEKAEGEAEAEPHDKQDAEDRHHFPTAYALAVAGFYAILFIEHLVLGKATDFHGHGHGIDHGHERGVLRARGGFLTVGAVAVNGDGGAAAVLRGGDDGVEDGDGDGDGGGGVNGFEDGGPSLQRALSSLSMSSALSSASAALSGSSHGHMREAENVGFFSPNFGRALLAAGSVGVHSVFESLSLGLADNWSTAFNTCLAIGAHKWATSASLGVKFEKERLRRDQTAALVIAWAGVTPLTAGVGAALGGGVSDTVTGVLLALSAGIFLYIAFEVTLEEFAGHPTDRAVKAAAALGGAAAIMAITAVLIRTGLH